MLFVWSIASHPLFIVELTEHSPIIIQNSSNPSSRKNLDVQPYDRPYKVLLLALSYNNPLHGHGEVANENPLILPRTLSIKGALVLLKRHVGKKMRALLLGLLKSIY